MNGGDPRARRLQHRRTSQAPRVVDVEHAFDVDGLYELRSTIAAHASQVGSSDELVEELIIVASELASNVIQHGGGAGRMRLWHDDNALYLQFSDQGRGITDPRSGHVLPAPGAFGGRGLWICRKLTDDLIIESGRGGRGAVVTAVFSRGRYTNIRFNGT
jgi:anti-sigma regulatory factor (Ser/Thr protein kinase)